MPRLMKTWPATIVVAALFSIVLGGARSQEAGNAAPAGGSASAATAQAAMPALAQRGKQIFDDTPKYASPYVGNKLSCNDCHLQSGTADFSAPMIDVAGLFPSFSQRAGHIITLQNRIQECFVRSEAGLPPPADSAAMQGLVAYIGWLSRDGKKGKSYKGRGLVRLPALTGDPVAGNHIYAAQCAVCHGVDGAGIAPVFPPLWGDTSYNDGAGMDKPAKMAAFVFKTMPQNNPGSLTPQQAYDVAAYVHTKPRPKFNQAYRIY